MFAKLLSRVSTHLNLTRKLGALVALLLCLTVQPETSDSQLFRLTSTEETFNFLDQDKNGTVSLDEYVEPHMKQAKPWLRIQALIKSGRLERDLGWYGRQSYGNKKERFSKIRFRRLDSDRDDALSRKEFESFLMSEDSPHNTDREALFSELDQDHDEELSYQEFEKEMDRQYPSKISATSSQSADSTTTEVVDGYVARPKEEAIKISSRALAQEKKRIEKRFESTDLNGDRVLTIDEFMHWQRYGEIYSETRVVSFETLDIDNDQSISLDEFNAVMKTRLHVRIAANDKIESETERREAQSAMEKRLVRSFKNLDSNDDEQVTQAELDEYQNQIVVTPLTKL